MKLICSFVCVVIMCTSLHSQPIYGSVAPDFTVNDIDGNAWNLQSLLDEGKTVVMLFGDVEDQYIWESLNTLSWSLNGDYAQFGPNGSNHLMLFFVEHNSTNQTDAIFGNTAESQGNFSELLDFPIIDANEDFLSQYQIFQQPGIEDHFQIHICEYGIIYNETNYYDVLESSEIYGNPCDNLTVGTEVGVTISWYSSYSCNESLYLQFANYGTEIVYEIPYNVVISGETIDYLWNGVLLPYGHVNLELAVGNPTSQMNAIVNLNLEDTYLSNNSSTTILPASNVSSNFVRIEITNLYTTSYSPFFEFQCYDNDYSSSAQVLIAPNETYYLDFYAPTYGCYFISGDLGTVTPIVIQQIDSIGNEQLLYSFDSSNENDPFYLFGALKLNINDIVPFELNGRVFHDQNEDGLKDSFEPGIGGVEVHLGNQITYTNVNGQYTFPDVNIEDYTEVSMVYDDALWPTTTTGATLLIDNGTMSNFNFGLSTNEPFYLLSANTSEPWFFCGFDGELYISVQNDGNTAASGLLTVTLDPLLTYTGASPTPVSFDGTTVVWDISTLPLGGTAYFYVDVVAPTFEQMGETLTTALNVITYDGEGVEVANNTTVHAGIVNCSYDPNDLTGFPAGETDAHYIMNGTELEYLVRFQNTGNYQAFNIRVDDQLDSDLDFSTFEFVGSSHACVPVFNTETGFIQFYFEDIHLPDSTTDEAGSHGWLRYRIAPQNPLAELTTIDNTAFIYFDFNPAVVTNTYTHTISDLYFGVGELMQANLIVYPNPTNDYITIASATSNAAITITDMNGRIVIAEQLTSSKRVETSLLAEGVYIVEAMDAVSVQRTRLVVHR